MPPTSGGPPRTAPSQNLIALHISTTPSCFSISAAIYFLKAHAAGGVPCDPRHFRRGACGAVRRTIRAVIQTWSDATPGGILLVSKWPAVICGPMQL